MDGIRTATAGQEAFAEEMVGHGLLIRSDVPGLYGRSHSFEDLRRRVDDMLTAVWADEGAERMHFPPLMPRRQLETMEYHASFPHLIGTVFAFDGDEPQAADLAVRAAAHEPYADDLNIGDLVVTPATCYPVYPAIAARGPVPVGGITVDPGDGWVFRREPSHDPARMQCFHMRELVRIGAPEDVMAWRDAWRERLVERYTELGLPLVLELANDPFFGRGGKLMARQQRAQELKWEVMAPIAGPEPTAITSFNYHQDHFGQIFGLRLEDGREAHSACLGLGEERIALALLAAHGMDLDAWPEAVRAELWT
jgi:seryl-tRNA synthetase